MELQRETMTDSLADIIQIIHLGGKSGTLTVERGEAKTLEEGFIVFSDGKIVEAQIGQSSGTRAFNYLNTWTICRFSFIDYVTPDSTMSYQLEYLPTSKKIFLQKNLSTFNTKQVDTSPLIQQITDSHPNNGILATTFLCPSRSQAGDLALQSPDRVQISRLQKRLLLLINRQRNLSELARLIVRSPEETLVLLEELERSGLIKQ